MNKKITGRELPAKVCIETIQSKKLIRYKVLDCIYFVKQKVKEMRQKEGSSTLRGESTKDFCKEGGLR